ncbi:MAG: hypothetical protein ACKOXV_00175 [Bacteroidota bacterium]
MLETLLGGVFGGALRLAPEVMKLWDRRDERKHELQMLDREFEFAKARAETTLRQVDAGVQVAQFDTLAAAFQEQSQTAQAAGKFVAAVSALVRPLVTYIFITLYALVKLAAYILALQQGGAWAPVLVAMWGVDDMAVLNMILGFWFVGRVYERSNK